ncbi:hypothetical protein [Fodinicola acaciae]|uniref:hypothetical protein n=1 Tax=Fodinicola acaciae TaxID=2681555 RepID=UPI0013D35AD6|nr:hypothetical protein [Fodinicola acaciae]
MLTDARGTKCINRADELFEQQRLADTTTADVIIRRVLLGIQNAADADRQDFHDDLLLVLLDELLFGPLFDIRLCLAMLLAASPYRRSVSHALADELRRPSTMADVNIAVSLVNALSVIGDDAHAGVLHNLIVRRDVPEKVPSAAALYVGHMTAGRSSDIWRGAVSFHLHRWHAQRDQRSADVLADLVYALGVSGDDAQLDVLSQREAPIAARTAASWWRNMSSTVRSSARV